MTEPRHLLRAYAHLNLQLQELREAVSIKERQIANLMKRDQELEDAIAHPLRCHLGFRRRSGGDGLEVGEVVRLTKTRVVVRYGHAELQFHLKTGFAVGDRYDGPRLMHFDEDAARKALAEATGAV